MITRVLVVGGYGNFGRFISASLAREKNIELIVAGRSRARADAFAAELTACNPPRAIRLDVAGDIRSSLADIRPDITIHTSGPFQAQGYEVARACIDTGTHYIDLSDGRRFVTGIGELDGAAKSRNVLVVSGASSVPCLTAALVDHFQREFSEIETLDYAITTAQKTNRGVATTAAALSYAGRPFKTLIDGSMQEVFGWLNLHRRDYPHLGKRLLGNSDIPDLDLFPARYPTLRTIRFYAGMELAFLHRMLWLFSGLVRFGLIGKLERAAPLMLRISRLFDVFGSDDSAFHMTITGTGKDGREKQLTFDLTARGGHGPNIPCTPAILLAKKIAGGKISQTGAMPCVGLITLDEYLAALAGLNIAWAVS